MFVLLGKCMFLHFVHFILKIISGEKKYIYAVVLMPFLLTYSAVVKTLRSILLCLHITAETLEAKLFSVSQFDKEGATTK